MVMHKKAQHKKRTTKPDNTVAKMSRARLNILQRYRHRL